MKGWVESGDLDGVVGGGGWGMERWGVEGGGWSCRGMEWCWGMERWVEGWMGSKEVQKCRLEGGSGSTK